MDTFSPISQFRDIEKHLETLEEYGKWIIFRIPFIQQYLYFWSKMVQSKAAMGMPISQTDLLETVHVKDICNCVTQVALTKKSMVWEVGYVKKRVYDLRSTPAFTFQTMTKSLSDALKEKDGKRSEIHPVVITEEQMDAHLKELSKDVCGQGMADLLKSVSMEQFLDAANPSLIRNMTSNIGKLFFGTCRAEKDSPRWYPRPNEVLTPFCIRLITDLFKISRNPEWNPVVGDPNDIRDITGSVPISISSFFMNNYHQFIEDA